MKKLILTAVLLFSITATAQNTKEQRKEIRTSQRWDRRALRHGVEREIIKAKWQNIRTHVICSTIFSTSLFFWINNDNITDRLNK